MSCKLMYSCRTLSFETVSFDLKPSQLDLTQVLHHLLRLEPDRLTCEVG